MKKEFFQLLRKGLSFMMNRKLALGYAGWKAGWQAARQAAARRACLGL